MNHKVIVGVILIGLYSVWSSLKPKANTLTLYYADWCPHCKSILPSYLDLMKKYPNARVVEEKHNFYEYKVQGYPTFVWRDNTGATAEYRGARTYDAWAAFLESKLPKDQSRS